MSNHRGVLDDAGESTEAVKAAWPVATISAALQDLEMSSWKLSEIVGTGAGPL